MIPGGYHAPSKGGGPQRPRNFWDPYPCPNGLTWSDQAWYGNPYGDRSVFLGGQPRPIPIPSVSYILEISYVRAHGMRNDNKILHKL